MSAGSSCASAVWLARGAPASIQSFPLVDRMTKINLRVVTLVLEPQEFINGDPEGEPDNSRNGSTLFAKGQAQTERWIDCDRVTTDELMLATRWKSTTVPKGRRTDKW
jgi:hypothetical protein